MCAEGSPEPAAGESSLDVVGSNLDLAEEQEIYALLLREDGALFSGIRALVRTRDVQRLSSLMTDRLPLHDLLDRHAPLVAAVGRDLGQPFYAGESTPAHALRAAAAVGLALLESSRRAEAVDAAARWYRIAASSATPLASVHDDPRARRGAVGVVVGELPDADVFDVALPALASTALALGEDTLPARSEEVSVTVLLDAYGAGLVASLHLATCPHLPPMLAPDPRWMVLFGAETRFKHALDASWQTTAADPFECGVLWSLRCDDAAVDVVEQESLGAAIAVGLRELRRRQRPWRRAISPFRLNGRTIIVGAVDQEGALQSVGAYDKKLDAVRSRPDWGDGSRVVVPAVDAEVARRHGRELDIVAVADLNSATRAARRWDRGSLLRLSVVSLVVLALLGVSLAVLAQNAWSGRSSAERNRRSAELRALSARLATTASNQVRGDANGTGLLLAMVSDDVAAMAGDRTETLAGVVRNQSSLLRILRPKQGAFEKSALAADGSVALLATNAGEARLVDVATGASKWSVAFPPGVELAPSQVYITAVALERSARLAAVATSTRKIQVLRPTAEGPFVTLGELEVSADTNTGPFRSERNVSTILTFSPSGTAIVAYGPTVGLLGYDIVAGDRRPRFHCGVPDDVQSVVTLNEATVVVLTPSMASSVDLATCATNPLRSFDAGTAGAALGLQADGRLVVGATRGNDLLVGPVDGELASVANSGPYRRVALGPDDGVMTISASNSVGSFGWAIETRRQRFGLRAPGGVSPARERLLWLHDGVAEVHSTEGNAAQLDHINFAANVMAFSGQDLAAASLGGGVVVFPKWSEGDPGRPTLELRGPPNTRVSALDASPDGRWLAAIFTGNGPPTVMVWPSGSDRGETIPIDAAATSIAFADDALLVGDRAGNVRSFERDNTAWKQRAATTLQGWPGALAVAQDRQTALAVLMRGGNENASIALIEVPSLRVRSTRTLTSPTIPPVATGLSNGGFLVAYGGGAMTFLSRDLDIEGSLTADLDFVRDAVEVPRTGQAIVVGRATAVTVDLASHSLVSSPTWGTDGTFGAVAASGDGRLLATSPLLAWPITVWSLDAEDIRVRACNAVGRDLSRREWQELIGNAVAYREVCAGKLSERYSRLPSRWRVSAADLETARNLLATKPPGPCVDGDAIGMHVEHPANEAARVCEGVRAVADVVASLPQLDWRPDTSMIRVVPASRLTDARLPAQGWYVIARGEDDDGDLSTIVNLVVGDEVIWTDQLAGTPELAIVALPYSDTARYVAAYPTGDEGATTIVFPTVVPGTKPHTLSSWEMPGRLVGVSLDQ